MFTRGIDFCLFLPFWYCILELLRQYRNFIISHFIVQFQLFKITKILSVIKSNVIVLLLRVLNFNDLNIKWVSHCCLRQFSYFSAISWWEQVNFQWDDDEFCIVLDQHAEIDFIVKQQFADTRTHYSDSEPTNLCSFSLMPRA